MENFVFPVIGKKSINSISVPELLAVLRKIESKGFLCVAHLARSECGRVFRYAIATDRAERDVAHDLVGALPPMPTPKHLAAITDTRAIGKFLDTLDSNYGMFHIRCALRLAPFVFVRAKELTEAEWAHFDLEAAEWRIPAAVMKMRQPHIVPLSRQAMAILRELHPVTGNGRFLFPGRPKKGKGGKLAAIGGEIPIRNKTLVQSLRNLGYTKDEMTFHGFRSMASTVLNEKSYNRDWIERQLAHTERNEVRAAYNYAEYLPERRKMMQEWADYITELKEKAQKVAVAPSTAPA
jgi:integrase